MFIKRVREFGKLRMEDLVWDLFCTEHDKYTVGLGVFFFLSRNYLMMEEKITNSLHELLNFSCKKNKSKTLVMAGPTCTFRLITFRGRLMFLILVFCFKTGLVPASLEGTLLSTAPGCSVARGHTQLGGNFRVSLTCR